MMKRTFFVFFISLLFVLEANVKANYEYQFDTRMVQHGQYESEMAGKFTRGITNTLFGWTEIMRTPIDLSRDPEVGAIPAALLGVPYGILRFAGRTIVGVFEVLTCWAPQKPIFSELTGDVL